MSREEVDVQLLDRYLKLLDIDDLVQLGRDEIKGTLSGLFLPAASDAYLRSDVRIMLVGKEPRKWGGRCRPSAPAHLPRQCCMHTSVRKWTATARRQELRRNAANSFSFISDWMRR